MDGALERDYSCSGVERVQQPGLPGGDVPSPAEDHVLRRHLCESGLKSGLKCQKILELVVPGWSSVTLSISNLLGYQNCHFNCQSITKKKQLNENQAQLNVLIIDLCICMFQSTDLYL